MKFLTNTYDPQRPDAKARISVRREKNRDAEWDAFQKWLSDKIIAEPQGTEYYTVDELKAMHLVGVYSA